MDLLEKVHSVFYQDCEIEKSDLKNRINKEIKDRENTVQILKNIINEQEDILMEKGIDVEMERIAEEINNNYPVANIKYAGRTLPNNTPVTFQCDIRLFITPQDFMIHEDLQKNNLYIEDPLKCNDEIVKIYKFCRKGSKYMYDSDQFGKSEIWLFPFEFRQTRKVGDCDDNSHWIVSYLRAAGLPAFRVRVVCGMCALGGHSTVYVLGDDLKTWYHLNSTGGHSYDDLTKYPTSNDTSKDKLGIKDVWFSFNDEFAWHTFKTESAKKSFKKEKDRFNVVITSI